MDDEPGHIDDYTYPAIVHEYNAAWTRIKTPPAPIVKKTKPEEVSYSWQTGRQAEILNVAAKLYSPEEQAIPSQIADRMNVTRSVVTSAISKLRQLGKWPYQGGRPKHYRKHAQKT